MTTYRCQVNATAPDGWRACPAPDMGQAAAYVARVWAEEDLHKGEPVECRVFIVDPDCRLYANGNPAVVQGFHCVVNPGPPKGISNREADHA